MEAEPWRNSRGESEISRFWRSQSQEKEVLESRLSPGESGDQKTSLTEAHKWNLDSREAQKQSLVQLEATEWRLKSSEERKDYLEECGSEEEKLGSGIAPDQPSVTKEVQDTTSREVETAEQRPTEGWKWTLNSGKARERTPWDIETQIHKADPPASSEKHPGPSAVEAGGEAEKEEAGAQSRPLRAQQNRCSGPSPSHQSTLGRKAPDSRKRKRQNPGPQHQPLCLPHPRPQLPPNPLGIPS